MKFRKKPVVIEAVQWTGANVQELSEFLAGFGLHAAPPNGDPGCAKCIARFDYTTTPPSVSIPTLEGTMTASAGDWIIRGIKGELYPCKPDIFTATCIAWTRNNLAALLDGYERALDDLSTVLATLRTVLSEDPMRAVSEEDDDALLLAQLAAGDLRMFRAQIERTRDDRDHWRESRNAAMVAGDVLKAENEGLRAELRKWQSPCADVGSAPDGWVCPTCHDPKCGDV